MFQCIAQLPSTIYEFPNKGKMGVVNPIGLVTPDLSDLPPVDFFTYARKNQYFIILHQYLHYARIEQY